VTRDELAAFDEDLFADGSLDRDRLVALARAHQAGVRESPGVDNLVYEWRNGLARDPLVERTRGVYVLALPDRVWAEFVAALDADEAEAAALRALHDRQARRTVGADRAGALAEATAMVLTRP